MEILTESPAELVFFDAFVIFLKSSYAPTCNLPVHLGLKPKGDRPYILYNTEQLTRKKELERIVSEINSTSPKEIWDYSQANCNILKSYNIIAKHVPLRSPDWYIEKCKAWRAEGFKYDIGFCGGISHRRAYILNNLISKGFSIGGINLYGESRDKALAQSRIHINIHYNDDFQIFEAARCELWIAVGVTVISEHSLDDDSCCINVPYDKLIETVTKHVLLHDEQSLRYNNYIIK